MAIQAIYPEDIDTEIYTEALAQCTVTDNWLSNQSKIDVYFDIDGFEIKVPAGKRVLHTGWDLIQQSVENMHHEEFYGCTTPVGRSGFKFLSGNRLYIYDNLLVFSPDHVQSRFGYFGVSERSLEEHIALINTMQLEIATIVAENLSFLPRCQSLKHISVQYARGMEEELDFSPLYDLPYLETLNIAEPVSVQNKQIAIHIDFSKLQNLRNVSVCTNDLLNYSQLPKLETISLSNNKRHKDLSGISDSPFLKQIELLLCNTRSLDGIGKYPIQSLSLSHLRSMEDISELNHCSDTLRALSIEACGKISDFSCLYDLRNLEHLNLIGSNHLDSLDFLRNMPNLKTFVFSMDVHDGDLTPCLQIPYAACIKMKRHYNLKEKDLPKEKITSPFQLR